MSIKQDENNSIPDTDSNNVTSSGSRTVFRPKRNPKLEERYHNWVEVCAKSITACSHTIKETEQFFLQQCDALPIAADDQRIKSFQYSVVMNHFIEQKSTGFSLDMSDREKLYNLSRDIMRSSPEHYGIHMSGYYLPHTERNLLIYEEEMRDMRKHMKDIKMERQLQDICFYFEETTERIECSGGRSLFHQLMVFRGVNEEDIKLRNPRFSGYICSMRELGYLPDFH